MKSEILKDAVKVGGAGGRYAIEFKWEGSWHKNLPEQVIDKILEWRDKEYAERTVEQNSNQILGEIRDFAASIKYSLDFFETRERNKRIP